MTNTDEVIKWNRELARAIAALGTDDFFPNLVAAVRSQLVIDYPQIWLYNKDLPPQSLYHEVPPKAVYAQIDSYLEGPFQEDPFYQTSVGRPKSKLYRLDRVTAGRLEQSDYYQNYYADTGTVDECVFLARLESGAALNLSIMRLPEHGSFNEEEYSALYLMAEPISELLKTHSEHPEFAKRHLIQPEIDFQVNTAFRTFGSSMLSPREKDVLELMLRGYGTDTTAERLVIAVETVRRHRKSIYKKLDVSSQTDLFSLFINTLSCVGEAAGEDPLAVYMAPREPTLANA